MPMFEVRDCRGLPVRRGDTVVSFRGETARFEYVSRGPSEGRSARVVVTTVPTVSGGLQREYYAGVFDLHVVEVG